MKVITLEEHFANAAVVAATQDALDKLAPSFRQAHGQSLPYSPSMSQLQDLGAERLADMDANGIDVQVISQAGATTQLLSASEAVPLAIDSNDQLADAVKAHPDRFAGFATLPTPDPAKAAQELQRCVKSLGFKGAMINGRTGDSFLDDRKFSPILEAAAELDVPIYLHPTFPPKAVNDAYYAGLGPTVSGRFATMGWGWHNEAGIHALRMMLGGVFDRHPGLQLILGHWGEMVPFYLDRIDEALSPAADLERTISEYFHGNCYVTPSGMFTLPQFLFTLQLMGADRIMYSVDYPFIGNEGAREFLENAPISPADKEKIGHRNAEKLLKL